MPEKLIKRLEREGKIRKQKAGLVQVEALLKEALLDLEEARRISSVAERATYLLAYNGMLKAGRIFRQTGSPIKRHLSREKSNPAVREVSSSPPGVRGRNTAVARRSSS